MGKLHWYKRDPDAALGGMMGLTLEERGAYNTVLDLIYSHADKLPDDDRFLAGWCNCDLRVWRRIKNRLIDLGKLRVENGLLRNLRATSGVDEALSRVQQAENAANTKWRKSGPVSNNNNDLADAPAERQHMPSTTTTTTTSRKEEDGESLPLDRGARADGDAPAKPDPKGSRLPEDWRPEGELRQWTIDYIRDKASTVSAGHELERFRDHWKAQPGVKGRKTDWPATWRNWIRKAIEMEGKGNGPNNSRQGSRRRSGVAAASAFATAFGRTDDRGSSDEGSGS